MKQCWCVGLLSRHQKYWAICFFSIDVFLSWDTLLISFGSFSANVCPLPQPMPMSLEPALPWCKPEGLALPVGSAGIWWLETTWDFMPAGGYLHRAHLETGQTHPSSQLSPPLNMEFKRFLQITQVFRLESTFNSFPPLPLPNPLFSGLEVKWGCSAQEL